MGGRQYVPAVNVKSTSPPTPASSRSWPCGARAGWVSRGRVWGQRAAQGRLGGCGRSAAVMARGVVLGFRV